MHCNKKHNHLLLHAATAKKLKYTYSIYYYNNTWCVYVCLTSDPLTEKKLQKSFELGL